MSPIVGNLIVGVVLVIVAGAAVRYLWKQSKAKKHSCGGDCSQCGGGCH